MQAVVSMVGESITSETCCPALSIEVVAVVIVDSHIIHRTALATEETTVAQKGSHIPLSNAKIPLAVTKRYSDQRVTSW